MLAWRQIKIHACFVYKASLFLAWCAGQGETRLVAPLASRQQPEWAELLHSAGSNGAHQLSQARGGYDGETGAILQLDKVPRAVLQSEVPGVPRESHTSRAALRYLLCTGRWNQLPVHPDSCKLTEGRQTPAHPPNLQTSANLRCWGRRSPKSRSCPQKWA